MRTIALLLLTTLSYSANAAEIRGGYYDKETDEIVLDVDRASNCGTTNFSLNYVLSCGQNMPHQYSALLIDEDAKDCDAQSWKQIRLNADKIECRAASVTIRGDRGTRVTIQVAY